LNPKVAFARDSSIDGARIFFGSLSGLLLTAGFPSMDFSWLSWIALVPLFCALKGLSFKNGFKIGLLAGCLHFSTLMYWLAYTMRIYGHLPLYYSIPLLFLLSIYLGLFPAFFSGAASRLLSSPVRLILLTPAVWVSTEYVRSFLFTGFPWGLLGYSQHSHLYLIQIADMTGVYGISYLIVQANVFCFLIYGFLKKQHRLGDSISKGLVTGSVIAMASLLAMVLLYGHFRIGSVDRMAAACPEKTVSVIQGNIDQAIKWDPAFQNATTQKYIALSRQVKEDRPDLVVWPETAAPFYFGYSSPLTRQVQNAVQDVGTDFLIGSPSFMRTGDAVVYFNSAYLIDKTGTVTGKYDKAHLVPFGEYVPLKKWLPFVNKMVENIGDFAAGDKGKTLLWGENRLGVLICYEIIFPELSRVMTKHHASLLVNITNDAWYGRTSAPFQHFSMAVFRAIENRRALVRSANTGISGFIDPAGRVIASSGLYKEAVLTETVPMMDEMTPYTMWGDFFALGCIIILLLYVITAKIALFRLK